MVFEKFSLTLYLFILEYQKPRLMLLSELFNFESTQDGQVVFSEGDSGNQFYLVLDGHVRISVSSEVSLVSSGGLDWSNTKS